MKATDLRIVFAGTPDFAAGHLDDLLNRGLTVVSAYSQPDRPSGRGKLVQATPVKQLAISRGIPVLQPTAFNAAALETLAALNADVMVVVAYGLLLPKAVLSVPRFGCVNVHASLLPRWRGAAPIERAILAGDHETGISIMQMDAGLDTGPVLARAATPISPEDTSESLTHRLLMLGSDQLANVLEEIAAGTAQAVAQTEAEACYAHKIRKEEAAIDWQSSAQYIHNQVRALYARSPAWCLHAGKRLRIISARPAVTRDAAQPGTIIDLSKSAMTVACKAGALAITRVQLEGKPVMTLSDLLNGHPDYFAAGTVLESGAINAKTPQ